jgi:hypothetical protein
MMKESLSLASSRRQFLKNALPTGILFCFGCSNLSAMPRAIDRYKDSAQKHKFFEDSGMTVKEVFNFAFQSYIPVLQNLAEEIGKDKFIDILKRAASDARVKQMKSVFENLQKRDLVAWSDFELSFVKMNPFKNALTYEIVEKTEKTFEIKYAECLFAETYREMNESEIGYALHCYPDYASINLFNPKIKVTRLTTLMEGGDSCDFRYVWKG